MQYSVLDHRPEENLQRLSEEFDIFLLCYGTLAGGFLSGRSLGIDEIPITLENRSLVKYSLIIEEFGGMELFQSLLHSLGKIAKRHNVGIGEVAAQYILQKPQVAGVIIGARNVDHLESIRKLGFFQLDEEDFSEIKSVTNQARGPRGLVYDLERDRSGKHGKIMRYNLNKP